MSSAFYAPNSPDWLLILVIVLSLGSILGMLVWSLILEYKYFSPFSLSTASSKEKWRRATIQAILTTALIPILGLAQPTLSPLPDQWPIFPLFCGGVWILILPIAILHKRWEYEWRINNYIRLDKMIKEKGGADQRVFASPFMSWTRIFMTAEYKRFFSEGYSGSLDDNKNDLHDT